MEVREKFEPDLKILHDVHHRLSPREAAAFAKAVEPVGLYWLEDPTPAEDQDALRLIRQHSTTPIAIGEVFNSIWDCNKLIENELIDFIRVAATYGGGITHLKRIIDLAALHHVRTGFPRRPQPFTDFNGGPASPKCLGAEFWHPRIPRARNKRMRRAVPVCACDDRRHVLRQRRTRPRCGLR